MLGNHRACGRSFATRPFEADVPLRANTRAPRVAAGREFRQRAPAPWANKSPERGTGRRARARAKATRRQRIKHRCGRIATSAKCATREMA